MLSRCSGSDARTAATRLVANVIEGKDWDREESIAEYEERGDLGSLEAGKIEDLIVLDQNPLEKIDHTLSIRYGMKNGILYDGNTLDVVTITARGKP